MAIYWDYENVRIPAWCPASTATEAIRNSLTKYGRIVEKRLYYDSRQPAEYTAPRAELDLSGFTLVDCPSRNRKETLDKKLIVDMLCFAWERARSRFSAGTKTCVTLITSDGDYSYALARLRDIGVFTVIIYCQENVAKVLIDNANVAMSWEYDVLGRPPSQADDESSTASVYVSIESDHKNSKPATGETGQIADDIAIKQPTQQMREKLAFFCSVVLNCQHNRNVQEGTSVYSCWADEGNMAASFYTKVGNKDRDAYQTMRSLASQKKFIEWGRRNLSVAGKPVIKVKDRDHRPDGVSQESYLRLTYSGLAALKPRAEAQEGDRPIVIP